MIQNHRGSFGAAGIESFINSCYGGEPVCEFRPILRNIPDMNPHKQCTKIDIRLANIPQIEMEGEESGAFEKIIEWLSDTGGVTAHIEIGVGYDRKKKLSSTLISKLIGMVRRNERDVSSAKITLREDARSTVYDLLENIAHEVITHEIPAKGEISFVTASNEMLKRYEAESERKIKRDLGLE